VLLAVNRASIARHILVPVAILSAFVAIASVASAQDWSVYGADQDGSRYSPLSQIDTKSVTKLKAAWIYHTGALEPRGPLTRALVWGFQKIHHDIWDYETGKAIDQIVSSHSHLQVQHGWV
jgi:glucose dehydrogenase